VIQALVVLGSSGALVSACADGHASCGVVGTDIVCAAVTILFRTTLDVLSAKAESGGVLKLDVQSAKRGSLQFSITAFPSSDLVVLQYAADFLVMGLQSLSKEYPQSVRLRVQYTNEHSGG